MKMRFGALALSLAALMTAGCAGISSQRYGSGNMGYSLNQPATRADVFVNLGEPDSIYKSANGEVLIYKNYKGDTILGIVTKVKRSDMIVVIDGDGNVVGTREIEMGKGWTVFSPLWADPTYPVPASELREAPENYKVELSAEK